ncbi:MAG: phage terminase large subunit family protein [Leptothrix sp. (in: b-proteobacteria)]
MRGKRKTLPDWRDGFAGMVERLEQKTGHRVKLESIAPGVTFRHWCEQLGREGMKVDGKPFQLDDRPAMAWIYDQVPSTEDEAYRLVLVLMKCAQVGFTVMEMLATIYLGLRFGPATVGMFLPDMNLAGLKSSERFLPIVRSVPSVHQLMTQDAPDGSGRKQGEGNVNRRRIGEALFIFSWTSGRATTESVPMDILSFDEVQEMTLEQMEKTVERLSASPVRFTLMGSTANWPDADIHHWYKRGSQHQFHSKCPTCSEAKPLDDYFPECIKWDDARDVYRYVCPKGHWLTDPQHGEWISANPAADAPINYDMPRKDRPLRIRSIHFPQFLSPTISAGEIIDAFRSATNMKNFFNRKLGKPYLDPSQVPVTMEHLAECERLGIEAGVRWLTRARGTFMGIDQMGNFNVVVVKARLPDGRQGVIHVEEVYSADPFARCSELMDALGVSVCVVEINPNYNDAKRFANRHPGKVFICNSFGKVEEGMIAWGDQPKLDTSDRRTSEEERDRYTLRMDQYKCMQVSMARLTGTANTPPTCLFPDRQGLVQEVIEKGIKQAMPVLPRAFFHFTKTALVAERDEETNKYVRSVKKVGIDPHFSYANMLCDVAWARAHGTNTFLMPDPTATTPDLGPDSARMHLDRLPIGVGAKVAEVLTAAPVTGRCGTCAARMGNLCTERGLTVAESDPACEMYAAED